MATKLALIIVVFGAQIVHLKRLIIAKEFFDVSLASPLQVLTDCSYLEWISLWEI